MVTHADMINTTQGEDYAQLGGSATG